MPYTLVGPQPTTGTRPPSCHIPRQPSIYVAAIYVTGFQYETLIKWFNAIYWLDGEKKYLRVICYCIK